MATGTPTVGAALDGVVARLRASGSESARLDAELLVAHAIGAERTTVLAHPETPMSPSASERLAGYTARRERGEPVAYIRGMKEFHGLAFTVDARALIPRPESELVVDLASSRIAAVLSGAPRPAGAPHCRVADVGCGSGAIAVALASTLRRRGYLGAVEIVATDVSPEALGLAVENAVAHGLADAIRFAAADLLPDGEAPFDLLLANLPYVPTADLPGLPVAASFEPALALDGGPDGLAVVRRLLAILPRALGPRGTALLEIGAGQAGTLAGDVRHALPGWSLALYPDLAGIQRVAEVAPPPGGGTGARP